ncbi:MAG TPA: ATP-binding protein [Polyangia bacterium]|nr:ATP-binding protein [Polyangia bacterium]
MPPSKATASGWREKLLESVLLVAVPSMVVALLLALATVDPVDRHYLLLAVPVGIGGIVVLSRRRWPFGVRAAGLIVPLALGVVITYLRFGFKGNASALVTVVVVLTGLLFGRRKMAAAVLIAFGLAAAIGVAMSAGLIAGDPARSAELDCPRAWVRADLIALLLWVTAGSAVVFVIDRIEGALQGTREALASLETEQELRLDAESGRHTAQTALVQAQRNELVSQLAAGVAHDFNNVLSVISTWSAAALDEAASARAREAGRKALDSALQQGQALTRQLTTLARPQARRVARVRLDRPVAAAVETLRRAMPADVGLTFVALAAPEVAADETEIQQIVYNLVLNARDAMPSGGAIRLTTDVVEPSSESIAAVGGTLPPGRWATLAVADSGPGVSPDLRERIFELFFTTKAPEQGTGLGLATVLRIAKLNGGGVALDSEPGSGATFTVYLPCLAVAG